MSTKNTATPKLTDRRKAYTDDAGRIWYAWVKADKRWDRGSRAGTFYKTECGWYICTYHHRKRNRGYSERRWTSYDATHSSGLEVSGGSKEGLSSLMTRALRRAEALS